MPDRGSGLLSLRQRSLQFAERLRAVGRLDRVRVDPEDVAGGGVVVEVVVEAGQSPGRVVRVDGADRLPEFDDVRNARSRLFVADVPDQNRRVVLQVFDHFLHHRNRSESVIDLVVPAVEMLLEARHQFQAEPGDLIDSGADSFDVGGVLAGTAVPGDSIEVKRVEPGVGDALQILVFHRSLPGAVDADRHEGLSIHDQTVVFVQGDGVGRSHVARPHLNVVCHGKETAFGLHIKQSEVELPGTGGQFPEIAAAEPFRIGSHQFFVPLAVEIEGRKHCEVFFCSGGNGRVHLERGVVGPEGKSRQPGRQHRPEVADLLHPQVVVVEGAGSFVADVERNPRLLSLFQDEGPFDFRPLLRDRLSVVQTAGVLAVRIEFDAEPVRFAFDVLAAAEHGNLVGLSRLQSRNGNRDKTVFFSGFAFGAKTGGAVVPPFADFVSGKRSEDFQISGCKVLFIRHCGLISHRPGAQRVQVRLSGSGDCGDDAGGKQCVESFVHNGPVC